MGRVALGPLFPTHQLTADKGVLQAHRENVKLLLRNKEGCFSFNSVYINKGKINQYKNEKMINCFPLFTHLISISAFLCVGALPWKKIDNFLQNRWTVGFHFWRKKKSASLLTPGWWCCFHKVVHLYWSELEESFSQLFSVFVLWFKACREANLPPKGRIF